MRIFNNARAQNMVEYILVVTAFILVFLIFLAPSGVFKKKLNRVLDKSVGMLENMAGSFNSEK